MMVKNNEGISIKKLLEDHNLISILNNIENITGEKQLAYIIRKYLKAIHYKNL
jgi:ribosomal protein S6